MPKIIKLQIRPSILTSHTQLRLHPDDDSGSPGCWYILGMSSPAQHKGPVESEAARAQSWFLPFPTIPVHARVQQIENHLAACVAQGYFDTQIAEAVRRSP